MKKEGHVQKNRAPAPEAPKEIGSPDYQEYFYEHYHVARESLNRNPAIVMGHMFKLWRRWLPTDRSAAIFDLGCGCGEFLRLLSSLGYTNLAGIDLSEIQIETARQFGLEDVSVANALEFLVGRNERYDLISAFNLFEHLQKNEILRLLELVFQSLRPGGRMIAITPNGLSPFSGATRYFDFSHETSFTPQSWRQLAKLAGFSSPVFEDARALTGGINGWMRTILWKTLAFIFDTMSRIETAHSRDESKVYTADMKIILTKN